MKKGSVCADVHRHLEKVGADGHQSSVEDGHKAELTHGGHGSLEPGQLCSLLGFYCCPVGWGGGQRRGLEHAKTVNPFGEQSWSQAAESEFMSVNRCSATACCVLEQTSSELF